MSILCKVIYMFNVISIKIPIIFFTEIEKFIQSQGILGSTNNLEKEHDGVLDFKTYYKEWQ